MKASPADAASPAETQTATPEPPELQIDHITLYHGSIAPGIGLLDVAEEDTVGRGVYFVDNPKQAGDYARIRSKARKGNPVLYEAEVHNVRLANLDNIEMLEGVMDSFAEVLQKTDFTSEPAYRDSPTHIWLRQEQARRAVETIRDGVQPGTVRLVTFAFTNLFTEHLQGLGYDGLKTMEGGERDMGRHATYVIFDPANAKITQETLLT